MKGSVTAAVPKVSVAMITYNQEKFIAQAIESVLMQQVDFQIEIIIGEDCSTDGTRDIVKRYAGSNPDIIRPLLNTSNIGAPQNGSAVLNACRGEYIAFLEGDDYWTDPHKLQKQVTLMDLNPQYSMCGTANRMVRILPDGKEEETGFYPSGGARKLYNLEHVLAGLPFMLLTFLVRNHLVTFPSGFEKLILRDLSIFALFAEKGPVAFLNDVTATYRVHEGGLWSGSSLSGKCKLLRESFDFLNEYFSGRFIREIRNRDFKILKTMCLAAVRGGNRRAAKQVYWQSFGRLAPHMSISYIALGVSIYSPLDVDRLTRAIRSRWRRMLQSRPTG